MSHADMPTSAAVPHHADRLPDARDLPGLHRDTWAIVLGNPKVFLLLPALMWFPFDLLTEWVTSAAGGDFMAQMRTMRTVGRIGELVVGTLLPATIVFALREATQGRKVSMGAALTGGLAVWGKMFGALFMAGLYALGGFILFVLPGFYITAAVSLAPAVVLFEGRSGGDAVRRSMELVKERGTFRVLLWGFSAYCVYVVLTFGVALGIGLGQGLLDIADSVVLNTLAAVPGNLVMVGILVATTVIYIDTVDVKAAYPVGLELMTDEGHRIDAPKGTGTPGLVIASVLAAILLPLIVGTVWFAVDSGAL